MLDFFQGLAQSVDDYQEFEGNMADHKDKLAEFLIKGLVHILHVELFLLRGGNLTIRITQRS